MDRPTGLRPTVAVLGVGPGDAPSEIGAAAELAELRFTSDRDELPSVLPGADVLFTWGPGNGWVAGGWGFVDRLRWIQSASDGVDRLLFPELVHSDVVVTNARGVFEGPIAEWVLGAILAFETGLRTSILDTAAGTWNDERTRGSVAGRHLLVVGPGPIGRSTATLARAFGMSVSAVGRAARPDPVFGDVLGPDDLHDALAVADHVLNALPLAGGTERYFDADVFTAMRTGACFYNVGRGATVDQDALTDALERGQLGGAALDVFEDEPLPRAAPLWSLPNVIVSPHVCGDVDGWREAVVDIFVDNLSRFVRGAPLRNLVDTSAGFGVG
jgi:phosphoglycerate dehydrogenase-like enzyme